jgi:multidrug efflux pump subunit AcrB
MNLPGCGVYPDFVLWRTVETLVVPREFSTALAAAFIVISPLVSLTLTPMRSARAGLRPKSPRHPPSVIQRWGACAAPWRSTSTQPGLALRHLLLMLFSLLATHCPGTSSQFISVPKTFYRTGHRQLITFCAAMPVGLSSP